MDILFKLTDPNGEDNVKNSNLKNHYPGIHNHQKFSALVPYFEQATEQYIIPLLGRNLYNEYATYFKDDVDISGSAEKVTIMQMMKNMAAGYGMYHAIPHIGLIISPQGLRESEGEGSVPARQWVVQKALFESIRKSDQMMDRLIAYLEKLVRSGNSVADNWKTGDGYKSNRSDLVRSIDHLSEVTMFSDSFLMLRALVPYLKEVEENTIAKNVGDEFFADLVEWVKNENSPDSLKSKIMRLARRTVVCLAFEMAQPALDLYLSGHNIALISDSSGATIRQNILGANALATIEQLKDQNSQRGQRALKDLIKLLYDNQDETALSNFKSWTEKASFPDHYQRIRSSPDGVGGIMI